jgi:two-component system, LuxR family, sensor kinase FixL
MSRPRASTAEPGIKDTSGSPTAPDASAYEREAVLRAILDTVPDALIVINKSGIIQSFSTTAERMFGFSAAEVCGPIGKCMISTSRDT